jgi:UDP-3-O-[3-hydroxymyristoyl] glucosamine N-acyltransferase
VKGLKLVLLIEQVRQLAPDLATELHHGAEVEVSQFATLAAAQKGNIAFLANPKYAKELGATQASAIVLSKAVWTEEQAKLTVPAIVLCDNPYAFFAFAAQILQVHSLPQFSPTIHPTASVDSSVQIGRNVSIGAFTSIARGATIGDGCCIEANVSIGADVRVGAGTQIYPNVTIYHSVRVGERCIIHAGTVIGSDGFGFAPYQQRWVKIPQTGTVLLGDDVEIGSNCSIDRGALGDTVIGRGTKLDNLIQIAHNVKVGEDCAFAANIAIAGSATIGNRVQMGGKAGVLGHLTVCDDVVISSCTLVTKTIAKPGFYSGVYPIQENSEWEKNAVALKRLNALRIQVRELEQALKATKIIDLKLND